MMSRRENLDAPKKKQSSNDVKKSLTGMGDLLPDLINADENQNTGDQDQTEGTDKED